ncbi:cytochrome c biogenesis protein CcdA [Candidatus Woesearchaeota archaeon]|nr:MAG: cytochrome c biogenesis protein CcdA [Candidatus Woesearchaeota archaeon]
MRVLNVFLVLFLLLLSLHAVLASEDALPIGLQKIIDYNNRSTADFALKISFFIAFVAGMLGILSPCILPFLPAYFSYTFKERKDITKMTLVFFLGFSLAFVSMGVVAGFLGAQVLLAVQSGWLVTIAGLAIIAFGIMSLLGKGFSSFLKMRTFKSDVLGTFLFGLFFALGWTACLGPILAGILGIGAVLHDPFTSGVLLFFYSLGNLVPLFVLSLLYDKFNLADSRFLKGRVLSFSLGAKTLRVHSFNLLSGLLFMLIGAVMVVFQGTAIVNAWDIFGTKQYFYSLQNSLLAWEYAQPVSALLFFSFLLLLGFFWRRR